MTLAKIDLSLYTQLVTNIKHLPSQDFYLSYDAKADVVYINFQNPAASADDSELTHDDVIIRYNKHDEIIGLTILHASKR
ncbi:DUF2283 domain-containing protein [Gloeocapsopsis sp. IPPAS B-1203]|uniref:DUF2283 domain-containing protein n=1 Tax=Gloeocapsopsis sp. IPPAS B-1203 TaxID=2049454 RepID=UPI000C18D7BC|nr:DUF2283 domain-containing protein [Gloeocapsopsis sp. IPPAS B-1203]PIG91090.1 hypothetical protein CSQ79_22945 [Gloeocapsopsis sp. IPPAS B-1203]